MADFRGGSQPPCRLFDWRVAAAAERSQAMLNRPSCDHWLPLRRRLRSAGRHVSPMIRRIRRTRLEYGHQSRQQAVAHTPARSTMRVPRGPQRRIVGFAAGFPLDGITYPVMHRCAESAAASHPHPYRVLLSTALGHGCDAAQNA